MVTEKQKEAQNRYRQKLDKFFFVLRKDTDADIIDRIRSQPCITEYFRRLVRQDIYG